MPLFFFYSTAQHNFLFSPIMTLQFYYNKYISLSNRYEKKLPFFNKYYVKLCKYNLIHYISIINYIQNIQR